MPVAAVRAGGRPSVSSGSQIATRGIIFGLAKVSLRPSAITMTKPTETSLPVPAVVGMATMGATSEICRTPPASGS